MNPGHWLEWDTCPGVQQGCDACMIDKDDIALVTYSYSLDGLEEYYKKRVNRGQDTVR